MPAGSAPVGVLSLESAALKLRSSCDCCGISKVKCDRQSPQCGRCTTLKLPCVYGPSKKFGKPPRKRLASEMNSRVQKRPCVLQPIPHTQADIASLRLTEPTQHNTSGAKFPTFCPESNPESSNTLGNQNHFTSDFYPSLPFEEWPQMDDLNQIGQWQQSGDWQFGAPEFNLEVPSSILPLDTSKSTEESHSCARDSYEIFRDLICPSPTLHAPESNSSTVSAQLDQVLQFNRKAIERLTHVSIVFPEWNSSFLSPYHHRSELTPQQVLQCPCAKSGHRAMVHASIISRILIWYQQAAGWTGSSSWGPRPPVLVNSSKSSSESSLLSPRSPRRTSPERSTTDTFSLAQATGFSVEHASVMIGDFSIEDQNVQGAFRNQLVLSELKKTANLITIFISITPDPDEVSLGGLTGLYQNLGIWLQGEYSRTVSILKSRLKVLNENLET